MQEEILAKHPSANLRVYVVWLARLPTDKRSSWKDYIVLDSRAMHYWDRDNAVSDWFSTHIEGYEGIDWDIFYLFGPDARWEDAPAPLVSAGRPIINEREKLQKHIEPMLRS